MLLLQNCFKHSQMYFHNNSLVGKNSTSVANVVMEDGWLFANNLRCRGGRGGGRQEQNKGQYFQMFFFIE